MELMKVLQLAGPGQAEVREAPIPEPGPGQLLVKVKAVSTCPQWDLHIYAGKPMFAHQEKVDYPYAPGQPGHEMTGTIVRTGAGCTLVAGQTVSAWKDQGHHRPGCYAEYAILDERHVLPVPSELPYAKVVSLELAMCVAATVMRLAATVGIAGKRCGVNGLGPAGLIALQMLLAEGAKEVVGIDPNALRRELAVRLSAAAAVEPQAAVRAERPERDPLDGAVEAADGAGRPGLDTLGAGAEVLPLRGQSGALQLAVDCVGYPDAVQSIMDRTDEAVALFAVQRHPYPLYHPGLTVVGYPGHSREAAEYALALIVAGKLDMSPLLTRELPLEAYDEAVRLLRSQEAIKICFLPGSNQ
ncbi:MAG: alcohol dehydrogenase catalytic domain-containing protein [Paenibacillaceae bacterium]|nr:alcohol dehydrogenase catalytic domain-containing protein [Paenibacillaceae bacterium]